MKDTLQKQVVNLELSKRLEELGVPQVSYFYWVGDDIWDQTMQSDYETPVTPGRDTWVSAFLVGELGEMLPEDTTLETKKEPRIGGDWSVEVNGNMIFGDTEADARARMLIYLLENNLLKASDL